MIKITNANKKIGTNKVLTDINLELMDGKVYAFLGENGSGKTMLFKAICGFLNLDSGRIEINGEVLGNNFIYNDIGLLLENPTFLEDLTGFDNLRMIASIRNVIGKKRILNVLDKVGLSDSKHKLYKTYSLGMKQRLALANVIMEDPKILIFDEPTIALDEKGKECLNLIIKEEKAKGKTILISSHEKEIIDVLSDEIYFMKNGMLKKQ